MRLFLSRFYSRASHVGGELEGRTAVQVACTRGQDGCKGGLNPTEGGQEGPHTHVVTADGLLYSFGTCHKGVLLNLGNKTGAFGEPFDELLPFASGESGGA